MVGVATDGVVVAPFIEGAVSTPVAGTVFEVINPSNEREA